MANVTPVPEGFHTVTPYLIVSDAGAALEFYKRAFNAVEIYRMTGPQGEVRHAEIRVGDSPLMLGGHPDAKAPEGTLPTVSLYLYVEDADAVARQTVAAGAQELNPVTLKFYGNREGGVKDPFGITWWVATRVEVVSEEEIAKRAAAQHGGS